MKHVFRAALEVICAALLFVVVAAALLGAIVWLDQHPRAAWGLFAFLLFALVVAMRAAKLTDDEADRD